MRESIAFFTMAGNLSLGASEGITSLVEVLRRAEHMDDKEQGPATPNADNAFSSLSTQKVTREGVRLVKPLKVCDGLAGSIQGTYHRLAS